MTNKYIKFKTFIHCPEYIQARDALIPEAEKIADDVVGPKPRNMSPYERQPYDHKLATMQYGSDWNLVFSREMNRLARERGVVR